MNYINLGSIDYNTALNLQLEEKEKVKKGISSGTIFFLEHDPPVITIGLNAGTNSILYSESFLKEKGYQIFKSSRGGDVTVHEPGQLVVYFVVPLNSKSVKKFINSIIEVIQAEITKYSINVEYKKDMPGLWVAEKKICAIGFDLRHGVSMHGVAINVCNSMEGFSYIVPCGLHGTSITSIKNESKTNVTVNSFAKGLMLSFQTL